MKFNSLELALTYLTAHPERYLFPIKAGGKFPPMIKDNLAQASNDPEQIKEWVKKFSKNGVGPNWGLSLKKSTLFVADVDTKPGKRGRATYDDLDLLYGWPDTETVTTPSGGFHKYYDGEHIFALGKYGLGEDIDSPNYVLIAGCSFTDGTSYELTNDVPSVPVPPWFYDVIKLAKKERVVDAGEAAIDLDKPSQVRWAIDYLQTDAEPAIEGKGGENTTFRVACSLRDQGISETMAVELMDQYYNVPGICDPEWEVEELAAKIKNAYAYASLSKIGGKSAEADFDGDDPEKIAASIPDDIMGNPQKRKAEAQAKKDATEIESARKDAPTEEREKIWSKAEVCETYVWCVGIERFIRIDNPRIMWKKTAFESAFAYLAPKKKTFCDALLSSVRGTIRRFHEVVYQPGKPRFIGRGAQFNCYTPSNVVPTEGDLSWWDEHLEYLFPNAADRELVVNWMAWLLQNITLKPKHALLIQGHVQGTGKSFIAEMLSAILNPANVSAVSQSDLHGQFNGWALRSKLLLIEELRAVDRNEVKNKLHDIITQEKISINEKNVPQHDIMNCFGVFAMTNDDAAISLDVTDRRYLVVRTDAEPRSREYYASLYPRLKDPVSIAAVAYYLMNKNVGVYDGRGRAPVTDAKQDMINAGLGDLEHFLIDSAGTFPLNGRVVAIQDVLDMLPNRLAKTGRIHSTIASILKKRFKAEEAGQFRVGLSKPRLYVINGCSLMKINGWQNQIAKIYEADKAKAGKGADDSAENDFGIGGED